MSLFQIASLLFAILMAYVVRIHYKKNLISTSEASLWISMWMLFGFFSINPAILTGISSIFYFERVFDLLVVGAFMVLTTLLFFSYFKIKKMAESIEKLVIFVAVKNASQSQRK